MTWVRLDDGALEHPKLVRLTDGGLRLWLELLSVSARYLLDGRVPDATVQRLRSARPERLEELATPHVPGAAPLVRRELDVWVLHDYVSYQPSRAQVESARAKRAADREAATKRMQTWRERRRGDGARDGKVRASRGRHDENGDGAGDAPVTPCTPPLPSPSPPQDQERTGRARKTTDTHRVSPHHVRAGHPKSHWFCGANFCVSALQHDLLERELGARRDQVDLDALYPRWDAGNPVIDNLLPWLKGRIAEQTKGVQRAGPAHAPKPWACRLHTPPCAEPEVHCRLMERESGRPWHFVAARQQCEAVLPARLAEDATPADT